MKRRPDGSRGTLGGARRHDQALLALGLLFLVVIVLTGCGRGTVEMPNVMGFSYTQAQQTLRDSSLGLRYVEFVAAPTGVPLDTVIAQTPAPGTKVKTDVGVTLRLTGRGTATVPDVVGKTQDEAVAALASAGLALGKMEMVNDPEAEPGRVVEQAPAAGTGVPAASTVDLKVSRTVVVATVPDVVGLAQKDAETRLKDAGFAVKSIQDFSDKPVGQVVGQAPLAGSTLNEGGTVTIAVSQGAVPVVAVPNVVGSSQSAATEKLQQAGFKTAVVDGYSTSVASGVVAGQNPPSGVYAERGATIQVTVSKGAPPANTVTVPNVTGKTQGEATQTLQAAGFAVETLQAYDANIPVGSVLGQAPSPGVSSPKGAIVTIAVSKGTAPTPPTTETPTTTKPPAGEPTPSTS